ncbi:MAG: glutathione S-transferase family protein [Gammaproteobacteria bacterium]|nr:glutathione S-transferase family protein [Gammaproteobacteria bacterium]
MNVQHSRLKVAAREHTMDIHRIKLYHYPATRSARVKWLLHELMDEDFDVEVVPLYEGGQYSSDYVTKNPNHNVPMLEFTLADGRTHNMLESGAMISLLADLFPEKGLAPPPAPFSTARADYLQMLHFGSTWMDMMLWQIRIHTHILDTDKDPATVARYEHKITAEVVPQLLARLDKHAHICGERFTAADCVMGQNLLWARAYGVCLEDALTPYIERLTARPAFALAYADMGDFSLAPSRKQGAALVTKFTG